jgi:hypothetical protein
MRTPHLILNTTPTPTYAYEPHNQYVIPVSHHHDELDGSNGSGHNSGSSSLVESIRSWLGSVLREMLPRTKSGEINHESETTTSSIAAALQVGVYVLGV